MGLSRPTTRPDSMLPGGKRNTLREPILVLSLLLAPACVPPQSVMGRPAAVLPAGESSEATGGGGFYVGWDDLDTGEHTDFGAGYYYEEYALGLGRRVDVVGAVKNGLCGTVVLRYQVLGLPRGRRERPGLDLTVEGGLGAWPADAIQAGLHLGASCSIGGLRTTPYAGFRYHWVTIEYTTSRPWQQRMAFLGLHMARWRGSTLAVEVFHGWPSALDPGEPKAPTTWGVNVVIGKSGE